MIHLMTYDLHESRKWVDNSWERIAKIMSKYPDIFGNAIWNDKKHYVEPLDYKFKHKLDIPCVYTLPWKDALRFEKELASVGIEPDMAEWPNEWYGYNKAGDIRVIPYGPKFGDPTLIKNLLPIIGKGFNQSARINSAGHVVKDIVYVNNLETVMAHPELFAKVIKKDDKKGIVEFEFIDSRKWKKFLKANPTVGKQMFDKLFKDIKTLFKSIPDNNDDISGNISIWDRRFSPSEDVDLGIDHNVGLDKDGNLKAFDW